MTTSELPGGEGGNVKPAELTRIFTFGGGHTCPLTGKDLSRGYYASVTGTDWENCRELMFASPFGNRWAFDYRTVEDAQAPGELLKEHASITADGTVTLTESSEPELRYAVRSYDGLHGERVQEKSTLADALAQVVYLEQISATRNTYAIRAEILQRAGNGDWAVITKDQAVAQMNLAWAELDEAVNKVLTGLSDQGGTDSRG